MLGKGVLEETFGKSKAVYFGGNQRDFLLKGFETLLLDIWPKVSDFSGRTGSQT